jgi:UDP-N-acetylglucosamine diphosphorylase / glucose-1-phosphate thymidylyltransferase / UDP-N-acetylgalactosamine diphosphorylase / glucosamine-1-phosphate N-acetyltransferase / galactosamine-1-phosphate N-acetyltransferase
MFKPADLFDLSQTEHAAIFDGCQFAWDALKKIKVHVEAHIQPNGQKFARAGVTIGPNVFIGEGTVIEDGVLIKGPAIIGKNCEIRHNAYIRDHVIIGDGCVIGNATELKNALLFNKAVAPHFNYIGDSILGGKAHLGAGVILSNFKSLPGNISVELDGKPFDTGLRKFGALLGDNAEIGCNCVLNPGSVIGRGSVVYPGTNWRGILPANMIVKNKAAREIVVRRVRET